MCFVLGCLQIPQEMVAQSRNSYVEAELLAPPLDEVFKQQQHQQHQQQQQLQEEEEEDMEEEVSYHSQVERLIRSLLKESRDKTKGWVSRPSMDNTELAFRKVSLINTKTYTHTHTHTPTHTHSPSPS